MGARVQQSWCSAPPAREPEIAATGYVAVSPVTWLSTGQSTGEAIAITLSTSWTWNGQSSTVSALTMVDWER
jgi:hypothetical protein